MLLASGGHGTVLHTVTYEIYATRVSFASTNSKHTELALCVTLPLGEHLPWHVVGVCVGTRGVQWGDKCPNICKTSLDSIEASIVGTNLV